jgi:hypothetical protein
VLLRLLKPQLWSLMQLRVLSWRTSVTGPPGTWHICSRLFNDSQVTVVERAPTVPANSVTTAATAHVVKGLMMRTVIACLQRRA